MTTATLTRAASQAEGHYSFRILSRNRLREFEHLGNQDWR